MFSSDECGASAFVTKTMHVKEKNKMLKINHKTLTIQDAVMLRPYVEIQDGCYFGKIVYHVNPDSQMYRSYESIKNWQMCVHNKVIKTTFAQHYIVYH